MRKKKCLAKEERAWLLFSPMLSVSFLKDKRQKIACSQCKATEGESVDSQPPSPHYVSYLRELMSDGLTWDHPWQIEMTLQTYPISNLPEVCIPLHATKQIYSLNVLTIQQPLALVSLKKMSSFLKVGVFMWSVGCIFIYILNYKEA